MAKLALLPTPIGNLEDITLRTIRYFNETAFIYAEDTRMTKRLLDHLGIQKKIIPFHAHNEHKMLEKCIEAIQGEELVVLVSDAGTPGISEVQTALQGRCPSLPHL